MKELKGRLRLPSDRGGTVDNQFDFGAYKVAVYFSTQTLGDEKVIERRFSVRSNGDFQLTFSGNVLDDPEARLAVLAPSGEVLRSDRLADLHRSGVDLAPLEVPRPDPTFKPSEIQVAAALTVRLAGRVMVMAGGAASAADRPVSLNAVSADSSTLLWSGRTDRNGYFNATIANKPYKLAEAVIGTGGSELRVNIVLAPDGRFPAPLILMAESLTDGADDCDCEVPPPAQPDAEELVAQGASYSQDLGTSCQPMTVPNRTLEEFDFFQVVRTTDPSIKGVDTVDGRGAKVARAEIHKLVFDAGTLSEVTGASTAAARHESGRAVVARDTGSLDRRAVSDAERVLMELDRSTRDIGSTPLTGRDLKASLKDYISVSPLSADGVGTSAVWRLASAEGSARKALESALSKIPPAALSVAIEDPDGFTPDKLMTLEREASASALRAYLGSYSKPVPGRGPLNEDNPVDWDHIPEFYQATSVAHGHILQFKQEWKADGYSLGDLVQSIPLAPGQQKEIVTLDWDRSDRTSRTEASTDNETLIADLTRDRDINEIANAAFRENLSGSSSASTEAVGGGFGLAIGPLVIGGGGGSSWASSNASQQASRTFSAESLNQLRDTTSQAASVVRNRRSTVVRATSQAESVGAITERIANFNRCHALTIQYFEVLRHFVVQERIVRVSECLFVPLEMTLFDDAKVMRWREILQRFCARRALLAGFDSIERLSSSSTTPPDKRFADDPIEGMSGRLRFQVSIARPKDPDEASRALLEQTEWRFFGYTLKVAPETLYNLYSRNEAKKEHVFRNEIAPKVAHEFLNELEVVLIDRDGGEHPAEFDLTVTSRYQENGIMEVVLNDNAVLDRLPRGEIAGIEIRSRYELPEFSKVILKDASVVYHTDRMRHRLVRRRRINDDVSVGDPAYISASELSWIEERNQLAEDRKRRRRLLRHLNDNLEYYHRAIWLGMDANRRFMLLDGFEAPNADGRSIASVVENRLIGIIGNCLVMPVAPGFQLDPVLREALEDGNDSSEVLSSIYRVPPSPPRRHSVPTRGVFGEAMPGTCKSCEAIDEDRFWRWSDYPLPDSPPAIAPLSTDSRFADPGGLVPTPLPDTLIKYQTVPDAPNPTGMAAALEILGKDVFKDLTGLSQNQKNAMAALAASMNSAEAFAGEAFSLAMARDAAGQLDSTLGQIEASKSAGYLDDKQASDAARDALVRSFGGSNSPATKSVTASSAVADAIKQAANSAGGSATITRQNGEDVETVAFETEGNEFTIGAAPKIEWIEKSFWVSVPVTLDLWIGPVLISFAFTTIDEARNRGKRGFVIDSSGKFCKLDSFGHPIGAKTGVWVDFIQSALDAGLMRPDPAGASKFQIRVDARLGYPARASSNSIPKAVHFPHSGKRKMPLAVILHGNSAAWLPKGAPQSITLPDGTSVRKGKLDSIPNHEGYRYLQDHMAAQPEPVISLSVNTNIANVTGSRVTMRAELLNAAVLALKAEIDADPKHFLADTIDFDKVGLIGHSRGGEAVLKSHQLMTGKGGFTIKSVCSIAATDFTGATTATDVVITDPSMSYLGIWGGLDGDVSGVRASGSRCVSGPLRLYDRCECHKAMIFAPACTHNRFNNPVWKDGAEWSKRSGGVTRLNLPAGVASEAGHEALIKESVWAFMDMTLNGNAVHQDYFRGETKSATGLTLIQQWKFGSATLVIDDFEGGLANFGTRVLGPGMTIETVTPVVTPAGTSAGERDLHVCHHTKAVVLDINAAGLGNSILRYDLRPLPATGTDISRYDYLTIRVSQLYDPSSQAAIDGQPPPEFIVRITDGTGTVVEELSSSVYGAMKNPLGKPLFKLVNGGNATQMALHTFAVNPASLSAQTAGQSVSLDRTDITDLEIEFLTGAGSGEVWVDTVHLVEK